ncbi:MAG: NAD-dependent deacylase [Bacteroidetes bacterium]|nr:NAD-dependent deacylase [Bacteroidota bacterium]
MDQHLAKEAAGILVSGKYSIAFTGAGISAESGIPPFRGEGGIWNKYDPRMLDIGFFLIQPAESWQAIRDIFYTYFATIKPNAAHRTLAKWEQNGLINSVITQNIDNLHRDAGNKTIFEFHGNLCRLICIDCATPYEAGNVDLSMLPPYCPSCLGLLKPDFVFFGEGIPQEAFNGSTEAAMNCDVMLIIGTSGEVAPANQLPLIAKRKGATIIEVGMEPSTYTHSITDVFLLGKAGEVLPVMDKYITELQSNQQ